VQGQNTSLEEIIHFVENETPSHIAEFLTHNATTMRSFLFGDDAKADDQFDSIIHRLNNAIDEEKLDIRTNLVNAYKQGGSQLFPEQSKPQQVKSNSSKSSTQNSIWNRFKKLSWPVKIGSALSASLIASSASLFFNHATPDDNFIPPSQNTTSTAQSFDNAVQPPIIIQKSVNAIDSAVQDGLQQTPKSIVQEPFQIAVKAYDQSLIAVKTAYPGIHYSPFLIKQLKTDKDARQYMVWITEAALEHDLNPVHFANQIFRESKQFDSQIVDCHESSSAGAIGISQIMPSTGEEYGFSYEDLCDSKKSIYAAATIMFDFMQKNNLDSTLSRAAYNGGQGSVALVQKALGRNITGTDWLSYMAKRRIDFPTNQSGAWQNETYNYVRFINGEGWEEPHQRWAKQQQDNGLPPQMTEVSLIIAKATGQFNELQSNALSELTDATRRGLAYGSHAPKTSETPHKRPTDLMNRHIVTFKNS
jgi:hypothetical protein